MVAHRRSVGEGNSRIRFSLSLSILDILCILGQTRTSLSRLSSHLSHYVLHYFPINDSYLFDPTGDLHSWRQRVRGPGGILWPGLVPPGIWSPHHLQTPTIWPTPTTVLPVTSLMNKLYYSLPSQRDNVNKNNLAIKFLLFRFPLTSIPVPEIVYSRVISNNSEQKNDRTPAWSLDCYKCLPCRWNPDMLPGEADEFPEVSEVKYKDQDE